MPAAFPLVACRFPIPMRGNELLTHRPLRGLPCQFPIPMRGNENGRFVNEDTISEREFPIPMRGNEVQHANDEDATEACFRSP